MKRKPSNTNNNDTESITTTSTSPPQESVSNVNQGLEELEKDLEKASKTTKETKKVVGEAKKIIENNNKENRIIEGDELLNQIVLSLLKIKGNCFSCALSYTSVTEDYKRIAQDVNSIANVIASDLKARGRLMIEDQLKQQGQQPPI